MSDVDELYQATIVEHDRAPRNWGTLPDPSHAATVDNPLCGDVVTVHARIADGIVRDIACDGRGCALSRAAASIMSTMVRDRSLDDVRQLTAAFEQLVRAQPDAPLPDPSDALGELRAFAGVRRFRSRRECALLPFRALQRALGATENPG
jgi:nitrogen fixation NifU-like protein